MLFDCQLQTPLLSERQYLHLNVKWSLSNYSKIKSETLTNNSVCLNNNNKKINLKLVCVMQNVIFFLKPLFFVFLYKIAFLVIYVWNSCVL